MELLFMPACCLQNERNAVRGARMKTVRSKDGNLIADEHSGDTESYSIERELDDVCIGRRGLIPSAKTRAMQGA